MSSFVVKNATTRSAQLGLTAARPSSSMSWRGSSKHLSLFFDTAFRNASRCAPLPPSTSSSSSSSFLLAQQRRSFFLSATPISFCSSNNKSITDENSLATTAASDEAAGTEAEQQQQQPKRAAPVKDPFEGQKFDGTQSDLSETDRKLLNEELEKKKHLKVPEGGVMACIFTCNKCQHRSSKRFSKQAYTEGIVIVDCPNCKVKHLLADNLGWFDDECTNVEQMLAKKGEEVKRLSGSGALHFEIKGLKAAGGSSGDNSQ